MDTSIVVKGRAEQVIEATHGVPLADLLRKLYYQDELSQQAIADLLAVHRATVVRWMKVYGIATRDRRAVAAPAEATA